MAVPDFFSSLTFRKVFSDLGDILLPKFFPFIFFCRSNLSDRSLNVPISLGRKILGATKPTKKPAEH